MTLLLETATDVCSVAIAHDNEVIAEVTAEEIHQHSSHLTIFIRQALKAAGGTMKDLRAIVLSDGPGSYTSLRVGAATAKGICVALPGVELCTMSTLRALAANATPTSGTRILATINSRRGEVYGQIFKAAGLEPLTDVMNIRLTDPQWRGKLLGGASLGNLHVCGPGQGRVAEVIENDNAFSFGTPEQCAARYLLAPASPPQKVTVATYEPFYLNPPFVTKSKKKALL